MSTKIDAQRKEALKLQRWRDHDSRIDPVAIGVFWFGVFVMVSLVAVAACVLLEVSP